MSLAGGAVALATLLGLVSAEASAEVPMPALSLPDLHGRVHDLRSIARTSPATALIFYSRDCHCFAAHRGELADLARQYRARGVRFFLVDSERHSPGEEAPQPEDVLLGMPILIDRDGALAQAVGAKYATYTVVFHPVSGLSYRGGIDSVRETVSPDRKRYLRDALDAVLDHRAPPRTDTKAMGCVLRRS